MKLNYYVAIGKGTKMKQYTLTNGTVSATINEKGAELSSLRKDGIDYMWYADPTFWGRTSPVLFPLVGSLKDKSYRYDGQTYSMNQHGFARDNMFTCTYESATELHFEFRDTEDTYAIYPFHFCLQIQYQLENDKLQVRWIVTNTDTKELHFSIGAHPAFLCPWNNDGQQKDYQISLKKNGMPLQSLTSSIIRDGLLSDEKTVITLENGKVAVHEHLFDDDALVLEGNQTDEVALVTPDGKEYISVHFNCPVMGIWSPPGKTAPFVCIEPWYGRCDSAAFEGQLEDREYGNTLAPGKQFEREYSICL